MKQINIGKVRKETKACLNVVHFNNAGASLMPDVVLQKITDLLQEEGRIGGYELMAKRWEAFQRFYEVGAQYFIGQPKNIAFATNATVAFNIALSSIPFEKDDVILTTQDDYVSNQIAFMQLAKRFGVRTIMGESAPTGGVDVQSMKELIAQHQPKVVAVTHVPTNSGLVQPVEAIGALCRANDIWYFVDVCQSFGQMPLDAEAIGADFMSATFRKFMRGPRGTGILYASDRVLESNLEPLFMDLQGADWLERNEYKAKPNAKRFETWERNYALFGGATAALEYAQSIGFEAIQSRSWALADYTRAQLAQLPTAQILDKGSTTCAITTSYFPTLTPPLIQSKMSEANINVACAQRMNALIDMDEKGVSWALRIAPHYYNTKEEIDKTISVLGEMLR